MKCFYHLEQDASGECRSCGKPLCRECLTEAAGAGGLCRRCAKETAHGGADANNALAGIMSSLVPGLGQLIRGEFVKVFAIFILFVYAMSQELWAAGIVVYAFGVWDGFRRVITEEELGLSSVKGHVYAGALLIVFGVALLPGPLRHVVRLDWIVPGLLVFYGLYLVLTHPARRGVEAARDGKTE